MRKWKCLIVDDEPPAVKILRSYTETLEYLEITGTCNNAVQAIELLNTEKTDLIFLDINMPKVSEVQLLKTITYFPKVIFTSDCKDYAYEAFELDALDYLLKPVSFERFLKAVNKFCHVHAVEANPFSNAPGFLYFRGDRKMIKVFFDNITYIESFRDYVVIHRQNDEDLKVKYAISTVENMLPKDLFLRIHRSYIVSINKVTALTSIDIEIGKKELPIGKSYPDIFNKLTGNNFFLPDSDKYSSGLPG